MLVDDPKQKLYCLETIAHCHRKNSKHNKRQSLITVTEALNKNLPTWIRKTMNTGGMAIVFSFICLQMSLATLMDIFVEPFHNRVGEKTDRPIIGKSIVILSAEKVFSIL